MAQSILDVQISYDAGNRSPIVAGTNSGVKRLSFYNVARLVMGLLIGSKRTAGSNYLQYQTTLVAATGTVTPVSVQVGDTLTIAGTALTAAQKRATGTITCVTALAGQTITINGQLFTAVAGAATLGDATFSIDTSDTATAASIVTQLNAYGGSLTAGIVKGRSAAGVVTLYAVTEGTAGNSITLASSDGGTLAVSAATLENGAALTNNTFDFAGTDITTGASLAAAILASTTAAIQRVTATSSSSTGVVTLTAKVAGVGGNAITTVGTAVRLAAGAATLTGGSYGEPVRLAL